MLSRRDFLAASAMSSALLAAGPAAPDDKRPTRCGILGIDHAHGVDVLRVLKQSNDFELVGVCDPDDAVRAQFAGLPDLDSVAWLTMDELLADNSIAMVAVESGVPRLLELARAAVDAGKHVHLDKPAGTSLGEFRALLDSAADGGLLVQMGYMFRYNPGFDLIRRAVKEGWLGDVYAIHASMCTDLSEEKRRRIAFHPGGVMLELGCHLIDMVHLIIGEPEKVTPFLRHDAKTGDTLADNTVAVLEYPNAIVTIEVGAMEVNAFPARRFKVAGTNGSIILNPLEPPRARIALRQPAGEFEGGEQTITLQDLDRHVLDFEDLAACIRGDRQFAYSKDHDYAVQRTVLRASGAAS